MGARSRIGVPLADFARERPSMSGRPVVPAINVLRKGRIEPYLDCRPTKSSATARWGGIVLEKYSVPAVFIPRHEHPQIFLHVVLSGAVKYAVSTRGRHQTFTSRPGTIFLL